MKRDEKQIQIHKERTIKELQQMDKTQMFKPKKKLSFLDKIKIIFGNGKKR
jgi:hypothetical protein